MKNRLKKIISSRKATIGIIGLGYIGLPLVHRFSCEGFNVIGIDVSKQLQTSDFGGELSEKQLKYCAQDVVYLHKIFNGLNKITLAPYFIVFLILIRGNFSPIVPVQANNISFEEPRLHVVGSGRARSCSASLTWRTPRIQLTPCTVTLKTSYFTNLCGNIRLYDITRY